MYLFNFFFLAEKLKVSAEPFFQVEIKALQKRKSIRLKLQAGVV